MDIFFQHQAQNSPIRYLNIGIYETIIFENFYNDSLPLTEETELLKYIDFLNLHELAVLP